MSQDKIENHEDIKGSRRSRKDEEGRDYICGCGKRYLSYPALYTHIKTKHDGHQPQGTQKTGVAPINKRKQRPQEKIIKEIQGWVNIQDLKILAQLDQNALGSVPSAQRIKKEAVGKQIWQAYNILTKSTVLLLDKKCRLQTVMAVYLIAVGQYVSQPMLNYYTLFTKTFLQCFLDHGEQIYESCFKGQSQSRVRSISVDQCKFAPIMSNFFIRYYLPYDSVSEQTISVMQLICADFCGWMIDKKLSIVEVTLLKDYTLMRSNLIEKPKGKDNKNDIDNTYKQRDERFQSRQIQSSNLLDDIIPAIVPNVEFQPQHYSEDRFDNIDYLLFSPHH